ncbi:hypothetical protein SK128_019270, partial [Halocaridina rubra]
TDSMDQTKVDKFLLQTCGWIPARFALATLAFLGFVNLFMVRVNLSVAIVAMVRPPNITDDIQAQCLQTNDEGTIHKRAKTDIEVYGALDNSSLSDGLEDDGLFAWNEMTQGVILGSYFYGYAITQILGGRLAEIYGTRWVFGGCIFGGAICTLLTPVVSKAHYAALIALRVIMGLISGVSWPSMHALLARWIPPLERSRFIASVYLATTLSVTFTLPLCGLIIAWHGWEAAFYVTGCLSLIWCIFWFSLMYDSPSVHPRISQDEREHIELSVSIGGSSRQPSKKIPWKGIATSLPVWAIIICDMGNTFGLSLYMNQLPTYMKNVLGFSIKSNGVLSGLPFLSRYIGGIIASSSGDWLVGSGLLSIINTRRIFSAIAMLGPAVVLLGVAYSGCEPGITVALLCLSLFFNGAITTSQLVNHTDIAPNFSGTLFGISNTFASIASFISPIAVGAITKDQQTIFAWQKVFWMCVPIYFLTEVFYLIFCSGTVQSWNYSGQPIHNQPPVPTNGEDSIPLQQ